MNTETAVDQPEQTDQPAAPAYPDPEAKRRRADIKGVPVVLAGGGTWLLRVAGLAPILDEIRDRWHDDSTIRSSVQVADARAAAFMMLTENYDLQREEAAALLWGTEADALVNAVQIALMPGKLGRHYTAWALSALRANGLDPKAIPAEGIGDVLFQLVKTGRACAHQDFIDSDGYMAMRAGLLSFNDRG